jgi:hypothetical protein
LPVHSYYLTVRLTSNIRRWRNGFSVLEAIIVLAITGVALSLIFSIGSRASEMGFRLGRRALGVADSQIATDSYRALIGGLVLPPYDMPPGAAYGQDISFSGESNTVSGWLVASRATPCSPLGPQGKVVLSIGTSGAHSALFCTIRGGAPVLIADLGPTPAKFSYSTDGQEFTGSWTATPGPPSSGAPSPSAQARQVYVRLSNDEGSVDSVALATSGRPIPWAVFDPKIAF